MGDFHQHGSITTLHGLYEILDRGEYLRTLERRLESYSESLNMALLLPCLYREVKAAQALKGICSQIARVRYLRQVVVALGGAESPTQLREAMEVFSEVETPRTKLRIVWVQGPRIQQILREMQSLEIYTGVPGKGQSVWLALGYLLASQESDLIALHDCDILTYDRVFLGRLLEPIADPNSDFEFCKGYYARVSTSERTFKGRVTRLFVVPLVDALAELFRDQGRGELEKFFLYHKSFKYPLAGEVSILARVARGINIACDWGLEVSTLSEVYHRVAPRKIAQIDLAPNYEHNQQELSAHDPESGLRKMVVDIGKFFLGYIRSHGVPLSDSFLDMLGHLYYERALVFIKRYSDDARVNSLNYDRHKEEIMARHFQDFLWEAAERCRREPGIALVPSWNRVLYSFPKAYERIFRAVEEDNLEARKTLRIKRKNPTREDGERSTRAGERSGKWQGR